MARALALALALASVPGLRTALPPVPRRIFAVVWHRPLVAPSMLEWQPLEPAAPAVSPKTGVVIAGTRDGWLHALRKNGSVAWEFQAAGAFSGQPRVDDDAVYVGSDDGHLYALDAASGMQRWHYDAKEELGTRPAVADGTVYVASMEDTIFAVDARTGAWKWHHRRERHEGFTVRGAASVIAEGGVVYGAFSDGFAAALDGATGKPRWERQIAPSGDYLDVDSIQLEGGRLFAAAYSGAVVAVDAATGKPVWQHVSKEVTRVSVGRGFVVAVTPSTVEALSPADGSVVWTTPLDGTPAGEPVIAGKWLLVPAGTSGLRFLELASGRRLRVLQPGTGVNASPAVNGSRAYVLSNGGDLLALDLR
ncbi:MAG TPA: PQQ-binding-like beta-propeller repeat protein [Anaeromyxobacteraceae bacterium]|nr:PQQ-binding-like beta-propeller repeat protein [Anaeromyxobacteraceae bacterium]